MHDGMRRHSTANPPMKKPDLKKKLVVVGDGGCGKVSHISKSRIDDTLMVFNPPLLDVFVDRIRREPVPRGMQHSRKGGVPCRIAEISILFRLISRRYLKTT